MRTERRRALRRSVAGLVSVGCAAVLVACGSGNSSSGGSAEQVSAKYTTPPTEIGNTTKIDKPIPSGLDVVVVGGSTPQIPVYVKGLTDAGKVLGWKVTSMTFDQANPATITSTIDSAIDQAPDAVVVIAVENATFASSLQKAQKAGVPIVSAVTADDGAGGLYPIMRTKAQAAHTTKAMTSIILEDAEKNEQTAHILQLTVPAVNAVFAPKNDGVARELASQCSECTRALLDIGFADVFNGKFTQEIVSYIQKHPEINYVLADSGQLGSGVDAALKQAGMTDVKTYGFDASTLQIKELQSGRPGAWTVAPYQVNGWMMADVIARIKTGGDTTVWDDEHLAYVLTAENAKDVDAEDPEFPEGYQDQFKELWGK